MILCLIATICLAQAPGPVAVELLSFDAKRLAGEPRVEIQVVEDGNPVTYSGVPLARILSRSVKNLDTMAGLRSLSDAVILVRGSDGYQAALSAAAVAMDPKGERYFLALAREGKPLEASQGPVRLIVPHDTKHVRWVKEVATVRLVRLDQVGRP